jgi:phosphocarrier protein HPr
MQRLRDGLVEELLNQHKIGTKLAKLYAESKYSGNALDISIKHEEGHHAFRHEFHIMAALESIRKGNSCYEEEISDLMCMVAEEKYGEGTKVEIRENPDYQGLAKMLLEYETPIDSVILYEKGHPIDPTKPNQWVEENVKPGENVTVYLYSDNISIDNILVYIGRKIEVPRIESVSKNDNQIRIRNLFGIHTRPAALFVKEVNKYDCKVYVEKDGHRVKGNSIMSLMMLECGQGDYIKIIAEGPDARVAEDALKSLIARGFDEV